MKVVVGIILSILFTRERLVIFHAGSLSAPFSAIEAEFERRHPEVDVLREPSGSVMAIRKVTELGKKADLVGVADVNLIKEMLYPRFTDFYKTFATNRMVIAYTDKSRYADEINENNWFEILLKDGVRVGRSDPNSDPCGYRTLLLFKLAERYYGKPGLFDELLRGVGNKYLRPKETDLIPLQWAGEIDYHFQYESVAKKNGFLYINLPREIDLSDPSKESLYESVWVEIVGKKPGEKMKVNGSAITYGIAVIKGGNEELAREFVEFILSDDGMKILKEEGLEPVK